MLYLIVHKNEKNEDILYICRCDSSELAKKMCGLPQDVNTWCSITTNQIDTLKGTEFGFLAKKL